MVAGSVEARDEVAVAPGDGVPHVLADNVVPRIGVLAPDGARAAIREMFLAHVIGGKHLSASDDFRRWSAGATPDVVLAGVELLARGLDEDRPGAGDVVVVDVGGATTDVHSVVALDPEDAGLSREVVAVTPVTRTVEGDLGMRWSALSTVEAAGLADLAADGAAARTDRARLPARRRRRGRRRRADRARRGRPRAAPPRRPRRGWSSAPRAGSSSGPARTCARSTC